MGDLYGVESDPIYVESMDLDPFWCKHWNVWKSNNNNIPFCEDNGVFQSGLNDNKIVKNNITKEDAFEIIGGFSDKEKKVLSSGCLRNKEYLIQEHSADEKATFLSLADLLFSFCFDHR